MQVFMVTGLLAGQHNTKLHGTNAGVISIEVVLQVVVAPSNAYDAVVPSNAYDYTLP